jgi:beta-fructofuranosidase
MLDDQGRRLIWGWLREGRSREAQRAAGWSGAISLPRVVSLDAAGRLHSKPAPELQALRGKHFTLAVIPIADGEELTRITYSFARDRLQLDCRKSSLDATTERPVTGGPLRLPRGSALRLHIFLDGSTIEVFANGRTAASRVYPTRSDSVGI